MTSDYQAFHADRLAQEQRVDDILIAALLRPLTDEEVHELRAAAGIPARKKHEKVTYSWENEWV